MILNAGSGDNTQSGYPREIKLDSYSIVNQNGAEWHWEIYPAPLSISADNVRNPVITIAPDQTYDISLTVTTPAGTDTKCVKGMIKGSKPVPDATSTDAVMQGKELLLTSGNVVAVGESFRFAARDLDGDVSLVVYDAKGNVTYSAVAQSGFEVSTAGYSAGIYFYMSTDAAGFKKTGKLLVKE
jgi:PKD repeat protein